MKRYLLWCFPTSTTFCLESTQLIVSYWFFRTHLIREIAIIILQESSTRSLFEERVRDFHCYKYQSPNMHPVLHHLQLQKASTSNNRISRIVWRCERQCSWNTWRKSIYLFANIFKERIISLSCILLVKWIMVALLHGTPIFPVKIPCLLGTNGSESNANNTGYHNTCYHSSSNS